MAAIEKICEVCGDYHGHAMYLYKYNSLQMCPKHRKEFRYKEAVLYLSVIADNKFDYCLVIKDVSLQGNVDGQYFNTAYVTNYSSVIRKMRRLLRCRKLHIVKTNINQWLFCGQTLDEYINGKQCTH